MPGIEPGSRRVTPTVYMCVDIWGSNMRLKNIAKCRMHSYARFQQTADMIHSLSTLERGLAPRARYRVSRVRWHVGFKLQQEQS